MYWQISKQVFVFVVLCLFSCATLCGCVLRSLTIDSSPAGAMVYLDDEPIGETPVTTTFTYYGTRKITLEKMMQKADSCMKERLSMRRLNRPYIKFSPLTFFLNL